jgi:hypothetical protein
MLKKALNHEEHAAKPIPRDEEYEENLLGYGYFPGSWPEKTPLFLYPLCLFFVYFVVNCCFRSIPNEPIVAACGLMEKEYSVRLLEDFVITD